MTFSVDRGQMTTAVNQFDGLHTQAQQTQTTLQGVSLQQSDFGRIPWLQTRVWEAFHTHTTDCLASLEELVGAIDNVHAGLEATNTTYRIMDEDAERAAQVIVNSLDVGPS